MLVVMQEGASEPQIQAVIDRLVELGFNVHRSTGVMHTVLGGVGGKGDFDLGVFEVMDGVKEAVRIASPYKLASRNFRPHGTVVKVGDIEIGGERVVVMAGPCSVESQEQISEIAGMVAGAGARVIRAGAFKPRSSPYSFQGRIKRRFRCCANTPTSCRWARAICRISTCCANSAKSVRRCC
jgi:3-deoxy-7-phosphoheptulonate synthase